jgi:hypothetical protein
MKFEVLNKAVEACLVAKISSSEKAECYKRLGKPDIAKIYEKQAKEFEDCKDELNKEILKGGFDS